VSSGAGAITDHMECLSTRIAREGRTWRSDGDHFREGPAINGEIQPRRVSLENKAMDRVYGWGGDLDKF